MTLDAATITARLATRRYGRSLDVRARTGSTNDDARHAAEQGAPDGHVVVADTQDAGRGAHGHTWSSDAGTDLYLSIVVRPRLPLADLPLITLATGLGVHACVLDVLGPASARDVRVKWPNDVLVGDRKVAGILVETTSVGARVETVVIGIGLNVNRRTFTPELADLATSLALVTGEDVARESVLATVLAHVETWIDSLTAGGAARVVSALDERLAWRGERVVCGDVVGVVRGVDAHGALLITDDRGTALALRSGAIRRVTE